MGSSRASDRSVGHGRADSARLVPVRSRADIEARYLGTPIEQLLLSHNLGEDVAVPDEPGLLIATCMDHRIGLRIPERFAFVIRTAGATIEPLLFNIAAAISLRPVSAVCVIGHSDCAMVGVERHRGPVVETLQRLGTMSESEASALFDSGASLFGIDDGAAHARGQCEIVARLFPELLTCPLFLDVESGELSQVV